jgi:hypothetical protein
VIDLALQGATFVLDRQVLLPWRGRIIRQNNA